MSFSTTLATSLVAATAPVVAPVVAVAPVTPAVPTFKLGASKDAPFIAQLTVDLYVPKGAAGYSRALWDMLDAAGVGYRTGTKVLVKVYNGGKRTSQWAGSGPLARIKDEPIMTWLDRVEMDPLCKAIGVEVKAYDLTKAQVKFLFNACNPCKYNPETTAALVSSFTFIAPPGLAPEAKQFKRSVIEHLDSVPLPTLRVPAGHIEQAPPVVHIEFVGDAPAFPIEPMIPMEPIVEDDSVEIVEVDSLEARTIAEIAAIWKSEFGYHAPTKIRKADLIALIELKRSDAF